MSHQSDESILSRQVTNVDPLDIAAAHEGMKELCRRLSEEFEKRYLVRLLAGTAVAFQRSEAGISSGAAGTSPDMVHARSVELVDAWLAAAEANGDIKSGPGPKRPRVYWRTYP